MVSVALHKNQFEKWINIIYNSGTSNLLEFLRNKIVHLRIDALASVESEEIPYNKQSTSFMLVRFEIEVSIKLTLSRRAFRSG